MERASTFFSFYGDQFLSETSVFTNDEIACFLRLLIYQWRHGHIPIETSQAMSLCHIHEIGQWDRVWRHISAMFEEVKSDDIRDCLTDHGEIVLVNPSLHQQRQLSLPTPMRKSSKKTQSGIVKGSREDQIRRFKNPEKLYK